MRAGRRGALEAVLAGVVRVADRGAEILTSALLVAVVAANGAEILTRSAFSYSFGWLYEVNLLLANWIYFIGICLVYGRGGDITMEFLYQRLPRRAQRAVLLAVHLATVAVLAVIVAYGARLLALQSRYRTVGIGIPNHLFSLPVVLGAVVMIVIVARQSLGIWLGGEEREAPAR